MCICHGCGAYIDTDEDPDSIFDTDDRLDVVACFECRESPMTADEHWAEEVAQFSKWQRNEERA